MHNIKTTDIFEGTDDTISYHRSNDNDLSVSVVSRCSSLPSRNSSQENDEPTDDEPVEMKTHAVNL